MGKRAKKSKRPKPKQQDSAKPVQPKEKINPLRIIEWLAAIIFAVLTTVFGSLSEPVLCIWFGWLTVATALILIASHTVTSTGKTKLVWSLYTVVVIVTFWCSLVWTEKIKASLEKEKLAGLLHPANDPFPTNDIKGFLMNFDNFMISGSNVFATKGNTSIAIIQYHGKDMINLTGNTNGAFVSGEFFGANSNIVALLETNSFKINPQNYFTKERPDKSTLVIRDQQNIEVLNVRFCRTNLFRISGRVRLPDATELSMTQSNINYSSQGIFYEFSHTAWFGIHAMIGINEDGRCGLGAP